MSAIMVSSITEEDVILVIIAVVNALAQVLINAHPAVMSAIHLKMVIALEEHLAQQAFILM